MAAIVAAAPPMSRAQSLFDAPPPSPGPHSGVRGIYNPAATPPGPANAAGIPAATLTPPMQAEPDSRYELVREAPPENLAEAAAAAAVASPSAAIPIEGAEIIARVDDQVVLASDVLWQVRQLVKMSSRPIPPEHVAEAEQMLMRQLMMGLIDTKLLYADFRRTVPAENMPKVEESLAKPFEDVEIPRLLKMMKLESRGEIEAALASSGTSLREVQRQFNEKTIAGEWLRQRMPKPQPITYEALLAYYQDHLSEYEFPAQVKWEELMVRFDRCGGDRNAAWRQICELGNEVCQMAAANPGITGPVFDGVAKARSHGVTAADGGRYDWTGLGDLRCEGINEALASLEVGRMSDGIESDQGFHIVRVLERKAAGRVPFTEAQVEIKKLLESEQKTALLEAELKKLRSTARAWTIFDGEMNGAQLAEMLDEQNKRR